MSRQAYRLERQSDAIRAGAEHRLGNPRAGIAVWQLAAKQAEFGHLVVGGYRTGRYTPAAALVRTLFEDSTLLAWMALPEHPDGQRVRVIRAVVSFYRTARDKGSVLPDDAERMLKAAQGDEAKKPPSMKDRVQQLDASERAMPKGKAFWGSHLDHVDLLTDYVHSELAGPDFTDARTRELLGYEALVYGHQYLSLGIVSAARLSDQTVLADQAKSAYERVHQREMELLHQLLD